MTRRVSNLVVGTALATLLAIQLHAMESPSPQTADWTERVLRWWIGDGRRPPVSVRSETRPTYTKVEGTSEGSERGLLVWWFGDGTHPPRPVDPVPQKGR